MATTPGRTQCITCGKEKVTSKCSGCFQDFCYNHLGEHRQQLSKQLDEIEGERNLFQQAITQQTASSQKHSLIQEIDEWEQQSIQKIKQTAEEARQLLVKYTNEHIIRIEQRLNKLTYQLKHSRDEDDIMETDFQKWKEELQQMTEQLNKPPNIEIQQSSTPLINKIQVEFFGK
jgi:chromosome segregation ATPase